MNTAPFGAAPRRGADPSGMQHLRWLLQALLLGVASLLLMGFYTVVRGAADRGPAVAAAAPDGVPSAEREERECDPAPQGACAPPPANAVSSARAIPRLVSFEPR